jgi:hypothetical protein
MSNSAEDEARELVDALIGDVLRGFGVDFRGPHRRKMISRLTPLVARAREAEHWRAIVKDISDDMECAPTCNSHFHDELCPVTNPQQAWRDLRAKLAQAEADRDAAVRELERWRHGVTIEGDFVCPDSLRADALQARVGKLEAVADAARMVMRSWRKRAFKTPNPLTEKKLVLLRTTLAVLDAEAKEG